MVCTADEVDSNSDWLDRVLEGDDGCSVPVLEPSQSGELSHCEPEPESSMNQQ